MQDLQKVSLIHTIKMEKKIVHVAIVDGTKEQIAELAIHLKKLKDSAKLPYEFLITNDNIRVSDARNIIEQLYLLIKKENKK